MADLEIRQAAVTDRAAIIGLIEEAAEWLRGRGSDQWQVPWPTREGRDGRVLRGLRAGHTWLVESGARAVATVSYHPQPDEGRRLWTGTELREPAVYLSRLVVRRSHAGQDIGVALIDWATQRARSAWGARWIRVDVWTTNIALHNYYARLGFELCRIREPRWWQPDPSGALFQRPTVPISEDSAGRFREVQAPRRGMAELDD